MHINETKIVLYVIANGNKNGKNASENVNMCCENALRLSVILLMAH